MKYLIANEQATPTSLGGDDETVMFGQNHVLVIEAATDTRTDINVQSSLDVDALVTLGIAHADTSAAATSKTRRTLVDEIVSHINSDGKRGFTVLFDALNDIKLPSQVLAAASDVEAGVTEA